MIEVKPGYEILTPISEGGKEELRRIELAARTCYKSEGAITEGSAEKLVRKLIESGHESMLEHSQLSVKFIVDRGISHEIVRHRVASFAQESTRYCAYNKEKFGGQISTIVPSMLDDPAAISHVKGAYMACERAYLALLQLGVSPQIARCVLPTGLKTEVVVTANLREWRHIFQLRCAKDAHPQIREVMCLLLDELKQKIPVIFESIAMEE